MNIIKSFLFFTTDKSLTENKNSKNVPSTCAIFSVCALSAHFSDQKLIFFVFIARKAAKSFKVHQICIKKLCLWKPDEIQIKSIAEPLLVSSLLWSPFIFVFVALCTVYFDAFPIDGIRLKISDGVRLLLSKVWAWIFGDLAMADYNEFFVTNMDSVDRESEIERAIFSRLMARRNNFQCVYPWMKVMLIQWMLCRCEIFSAKFREAAIKSPTP